MTTRREFLKQAGAGALLACSGLPLGALAAAKKKKRRYLVSTLSPYWELDQDFGPLGPARKLALPPSLDLSLAKRQRYRTMLTAVDEDGGNLKRIEIPSTFHTLFSSPAHRLVYLISNTFPAFLVIFDADTLELERFFIEPRAPLARNYTGHGLAMPGGDTIALGMNYPLEIGKFGEISLRDPVTLEERGRFASHGFDLHEIRLSQDRKYFVCGHYGSYLGHWRYKGLEVYSGYSYKEKPAPGIVYPATSTLIGVNDGKRFRLLCDVEGGQQGHVDSDESYQLYQAAQRALIRNRTGIESNPRVREGQIHEPDGSEFAYTQKGAGIAVAYDPLHQEVLVPFRGTPHRMMVTDTRTQKRRDIDLFSQLGWMPPDQDFTHGIELHPDGKHYVLSSSRGFVVAERGTHRVNKRKTLEIPLLIHTHLHVL